MDAATFDRIAPVYDRFALDAAPERIASGFAYADGPVERVLDLAGGTGRAAAALPDRDVTVVDAAPGMLARARAKGLPAVRGDATRLPFRDGAFDAVVVTDALHHLDAPAALDEAARVLRPGGVLVAGEFDPGTLRGRALVAAERLVGFDSAFYRPGELAALFAAAGLRPHALASGFSYALVGVRPRA